MDEPLQPVDDLPAEARELMAKVALQIGDVQARVRKEEEAIRRRADRKIEEITVRADKEIEGHIEEAVAVLKPLQVAYAKEGQLDEALAIRDQIRQLLARQTPAAEPDPGNLLALHTQVGKTFLFEVTGSRSGPVWGTDVYTSDSKLATAAVHAGKVRVGQRKAVRVTVVQPPASFDGSTRHGVTTFPYGPYPGAYRFE